MIAEISGEIIGLEKQVSQDKLLCGKPPSIPDGQVCIQVGFQPLDYKEQLKPLAKPHRKVEERGRRVIAKQSLSRNF